MAANRVDDDYRYTDPTPGRREEEPTAAEEMVDRWLAAPDEERNLESLGLGSGGGGGTTTADTVAVGVRRRLPTADDPSSSSLPTGAKGSGRRTNYETSRRRGETETEEEGEDLLRVSVAEDSLVRFWAGAIVAFLSLGLSLGAMYLIPRVVTGNHHHQSTGTSQQGNRTSRSSGSGFVRVISLVSTRSGAWLGTSLSWTAVSVTVGLIWFFKGGDTSSSSSIAALADSIPAVAVGILALVALAVGPYGLWRGFRGWAAISGVLNSAYWDVLIVALLVLLLVLLALYSMVWALIDALTYSM